ncbi:alpha-(1,3)-fucosyltransferase 10-like [Dendronephthya gigantea]|uniref:alpha-(1,3)-fucosyltransferase 10-like n=1 Tax=Dendronephthya gigantea TaxID=151771 RepID=UPI00106B46E8|nr:alpha-(1,3)-fucosyltransferase 10-like [Dendronephthya gigantea]
MVIRSISRREHNRKYFYFLLLLILLAVNVIKYASLGKQNGKRLVESQVKKAKNGRHIKLLYWSTVFGNKVQINDVSKLPYFHVNHQCSSFCELTVNKSQSMEVDAIIIHVRDESPFPSPEKYSHIPFILHTNENPAYTDLLKNPLFLSHFKYILSYRLDADFPMSLFKKPDLSTPVPFKRKTKLVFAAFSHCERFRTSYLAELMNYISVDSYGACLKNKNGLTRRYAEDFKKVKIEIAKYYKFTLVFMNADCEYFVDDQLTHALTAGSVPVYMGTEKIDMFLPGNLNSSIIKVRDFKTPKELAMYLKYLSTNEHQYNKYLRWKYEGFKFPAIPPSNVTSILHQWESPDTVYCKICKKILHGKTPKSSLKPDSCNKRTDPNFAVY